MKSEIENPYKVNDKLYKKIIWISLTAVFCSWLLGLCEHLAYITEMLKNIGYGCIASAVVAWIIDIRTTKDKNEKANSLYQSVYQMVQGAIRMYIEEFTRTCGIAYPNIDFSKEKHTWYEWYKLTEDYFSKCDEKRQKELVQFFVESWQYNADQVRDASIHVLQQQDFLEANDVINDKLKSLLQNIYLDFKHTGFELHARWWLKPGECTSDKSEDFFNWIRATNEDLKRYIEEWSDIRFYNYYRFGSEHSFMSDDKEELARAIIEAEKVNAKD